MSTPATAVPLHRDRRVGIEHKLAGRERRAVAAAERETAASLDAPDPQVQPLFARHPLKQAVLFDIEERPLQASLFVGSDGRGARGAQLLNRRTSCFLGQRRGG